VAPVSENRWHRFLTAAQDIPVTYPIIVTSSPHLPPSLTHESEQERERQEERFHGDLRAQPWDSRIEARVWSSNPVGPSSPRFLGCSSTLTMSGDTPCLGFGRSTFLGTISWIPLGEWLLYGPRTDSNQWLKCFLAALSGAYSRVHTEPGGTEFPNSVAPVSIQVF
jgi:hypothetical protein